MTRCAQAEPLGQVGQIGGEIGGDAERGIARADPLDILVAALLGDLQPPAEMLGQQGEPFGHDLGEDRGALAAAGDEQAEDAVLAQRREGLVAQRQHLVAHRIADQMDLVRGLARQPLDLVIGGGDRIDPARHQPVDPAEHRILLVDQRRDAVAPRGEQSRARPDSRRSRSPPRAGRSRRAAAPSPGRSAIAFDRPEPADRPAGQPPGGQDMDLRLVEQARECARRARR